VDLLERCAGEVAGCQPSRLEFQEVGEGQGQYEMVPTYYYVGSGGRYQKKVVHTTCKGWSAHQWCVVALLAVVFLLLVLLSLLARIATSFKPPTAEAGALQLRSSTTRPAARSSTAASSEHANGTSHAPGRTPARAAVSGEGGPLAREADGGEKEHRARFDCMDFSHTWSREKKLWCCLRDDTLLVCPETATTTTTAATSARPPYNCRAGFPGLKNRWSHAKKEWCCQRRLPVWTSRQQRWCCRQGAHNEHCQEEHGHGRSEVPEVDAEIPAEEPSTPSSTSAGTGAAERGREQAASTTAAATARPARTGLLGAPSWVGCYSGPQGYAVKRDALLAESSVRCQVQCRGDAYMVVHDRGWCTCLERLPPPSHFAQVSEILCGGICKGEVGLSPRRYCGTSSTFAVYAVSS